MFFLFFAILFLVLSVVLGKLAFKKGKKPRNIVLTQISCFAIMCLLFLCVPIIAYAEGGASSAASSIDVGFGRGIGLIASALAVGLSGIGAGIAVAATGPAAIGATTENEKLFGKTLMVIAMGEAIALYGFLVSLLIVLTKV